jgi:hypothetical protein
VSGSPATDRPIAAIRPIDTPDLARHRLLFGDTSRSRALALAEALASSPAWSRLGRHATLVVRPGPPGLIGVLGRIDDDDRPLLDALGWHVDRLLDRLRPMPYPAVEAACDQLAHRLRRLLGSEGLERVHLVGIPRGGLVVAGLLAYALGIPSGRVGMPTDREVPDEPLVVVDDCVLSGTRLGQWLDAHQPLSNVIATHLASVPACREAILASRPEVSHCIAAVDLHDHAAARDDDWHERWRARSPDDLWTGDPDHVVFPWNEPDSQIWNPRRSQAERAWRVVPPAWCVKNRAEGRDEVGRIQVNELDHGGALRPADDVLWATIDGGLVVAAASGGTPVRLQGVAAEVWQGLIDHGDLDRMVEDITSAYGVDSAEVRDDLARLTQRFTDRGLLATT